MLWEDSSREVSIEWSSLRTSGEVMDLPRRLARDCWAESERLRRTSKRGDSERKKMLDMMMKENKVGMVREPRQEVGCSWIWKKPKFTHCVRENPKAMNMPARTTLRPLLFGDAHSDCQTGTVAANIPTPNPRITLPTVN